MQAEKLLYFFFTEYVDKVGGGMSGLFEYSHPIGSNELPADTSDSLYRFTQYIGELFICYWFGIGQAGQAEVLLEDDQTCPVTVFNKFFGFILVQSELQAEVRSVGAANEFGI